MSGFIKKIWKDRVTEFPTRRSLTKQDGSVDLVTVAREEGTVSQEGDAFSAQNMNDLEERVKTAFDAVDSSLTEIGSVVTEFKSLISDGGSIGTSVWKPIASMSLEKGKWLVFAKVNLQNNTSTSLMQRIIKTDTGEVLNSDSVLTTQRYLDTVAYVDIIETTSITLQAYNDNTGTNAYAYSKIMFAVRVG